MASEVLGKRKIGTRIWIELFPIVICFYLCFSGLAAGSELAGARKANAWTVHWQPASLVNGSPALFRVTTAVRCKSLTGTFLGHEVFFFFDTKQKVWYGIAGISLETPPGQFTLHLQGETASGNKVEFMRRLAVRRAKYPNIAVSVSKQYTEPSANQLQEISRDKSLKQLTFQHMNPERKWKGDFAAPVQARISDVFGTRRIFNGETKSVHQGLDYAVPAGTQVAAVNAGTVLLAQPLYFEGNCVVIDHGQGLLSLYLHLSEFTVKEGETVARGQEIGLSGGTGRASGPHLHLAVRWQGVYVNPATLLRLNLP
jgi:hypothetical protein